MLRSARTIVQAMLFYKNNAHLLTNQFSQSNQGLYTEYILLSLFSLECRTFV